MHHPIPGTVHIAPRRHPHKRRWWRPLLWTGFSTLVLLLAWQAVTSRGLRAAEAADTVAINAAWQFVDESKPGAPFTHGALTIATADAPAPVAARFHISSTMQALALQLNQGELGGVPLAQVEELTYCTRLVDGPRPYAVTLQLNVDADVTDADHSWQGRLVYTPAYNGAVIQGEWQCWNTLVGKWWATGGPVAEFAPADAPQPLGTLLARFTNMGINANYSVVALKAGDGWRDFMGEASPVAIRIEDERYDVAFGTLPQPTEVLLPVVFNEPQATTQQGNRQDGDNQKEDKKAQGKNKDKERGKDKDKPDNANKGRGRELQLDWDAADWENIDWDKVDWDAVQWDKVRWATVDWDKIDWDKIAWDKVKWDRVNWQQFGWRAEAFRAFVDEVKACKKQGWQEAGFRNQGQCVAYYLSAHSPAYLNWDRGWNGEGWDRAGDDQNTGRNDRDDDNRNRRDQRQDRDDDND